MREQERILSLEKHLLELEDEVKYWKARAKRHERKEQAYANKLRILDKGKCDGI